MSIVVFNFKVKNHQQVERHTQLIPFTQESSDYKSLKKLINADFLRFIEFKYDILMWHCDNGLIISNNPVFDYLDAHGNNVFPHIGGDIAFTGGKYDEEEGIIPIPLSEVQMYFLSTLDLQYKGLSQNLEIPQPKIIPFTSWDDLNNL